jgi:hypothetical protein
MSNLSYIEAVNKQRPSLSLYEWVKKDPKKRIPELYRDKTPSALYNRAFRFQDWFKTYPGDGVLFFHDVLLSQLSGVHPGDLGALRPKEYNLLFNYLYSYKSSFTVRSRGALAVFLLMCPYMAVPLYRFRKQFDPQAFTDLVHKIVIHKSFREYTEGDIGKQITQFIWNAVLLHQAPIGICDNAVLMHLYYAYTHTAIQRFFFLSTSRAAVKQHIINAFNTYKETCLLLDNW